MASPADLVSPGRDGILGVMAAARATISMRYHGVVTSAMSGVPSVAVTFSPKLGTIAESLGLPAATPDIAGIRTIPALALALGEVDPTDEVNRAAVSGNAIDLLREEG